jgi:serine protease inhibitor
MHLRTLRLAALPFLALAACTDDPVVAADFEEARSSLARDAASSKPEDVTAVAAANTTFGLALNRGLVKPGENVVLSPASISSALAMAYGGAQGETARAFEAVLGFDGHTHPGMNSVDLALATRAGDGHAVDGSPLKFAVNNALFAQKGYPFKTTYLDLLARDYGAGIKLANFRTDPEGELGRINSFRAKDQGPPAAREHRHDDAGGPRQHGLHERRVGDALRRVAYARCNISWRIGDKFREDDAPGGAACLRG